MSQKSSYQNGEQFYNRLHLIFNALIAVSLFPFAIVYLELDRGTAQEPAILGLMSDIMSYLVPVLVGSIIVFSFKAYRNNIMKVNDLPDLRDKLDLYYKLSLRKYISLGAASLLTILMFYLTHSQIFIVTYVFALIAYSLGRPTLKIIGEDCRLSKNEKKILEEKLLID